MLNAIAQPRRASDTQVNGTTSSAVRTLPTSDATLDAAVLAVITTSVSDGERWGAALQGREEGNDEE